MIDEKTTKLVVRIDAHFDYLLPPGTLQQQALRAQANLIIAKAAYDLTDVVKLLVIQLADARNRIAIND